jgi:hypothetical protein
MFDRTWAGCGSPNPIRVFARLNKRDYDPEKGGTGVEYVPLDITDSDGPRWKKHSDDAVDAAVFLVSGTAAFTAAFKDIAFDAILLSDFATEEEMSRLLEGFQVVSAGLLPAQPGSRRNYPFFKFGHISNRIAEEVEVRCTPQSAPRLTRLWFIAANLVPGNSGSPIFHVKLSPPGIRFSGEMRTMLVGVQSISFSGADIAGMTPISFVYDIVKSMKLPDTDLRRGTK